MTLLNLDQLRAANIKRQKEWPGGEHIDLYFRALEMFGEAGELVNLLKKQVRIDRAIKGTAEGQVELTAAIRDEIGDVIICLDLIGMTGVLSLENPPPGWDKNSFDRNSLAQLGSLLGSATGRVCDAIDTRLQFYVSDDDDAQPDRQIGEELNWALLWVYQIAVVLDLDPRSCVSMKFNATSAKHGLKTRMST